MGSCIAHISTQWSAQGAGSQLLLPRSLDSVTIPHGITRAQSQLPGEHTSQLP